MKAPLHVKCVFNQIAAAGGKGYPGHAEARVCRGGQRGVGAIFLFVTAAVRVQAHGACGGFDEAPAQVAVDVGVGVAENRVSAAGVNRERYLDPILIGGARSSTLEG